MNYSEKDLQDISEILESKVLNMEALANEFAKSGSIQRAHDLTVGQLRIQVLLDKTKLIIESRNHFSGEGYMQSSSGVDRM
jgi:hypothetical protein